MAALLRSAIILGALTTAGAVGASNDPNPPDASGNAKKPGSVPAQATKAKQAAPARPNQDALRARQNAVQQKGSPDNSEAARSLQAQAAAIQRAQSAKPGKPAISADELANRTKQAEEDSKANNSPPRSLTEVQDRKLDAAVKRSAGSDGQDLGTDVDKRIQNAYAANAGKLKPISTAKEMLQKAHLNYLAQARFQGAPDADGNIRFVRNGQPYLIQIDAGDPQFYCVVMPNVRQLRDDKERAEAVAAAAYANSKAVAAKIYPEGDVVRVTFEQYLRNSSDAAQIFPKALDSIDSARARFEGRMQKQE